MMENKKQDIEEVVNIEEQPTPLAAIFGQKAEAVVSDPDEPVTKEAPKKSVNKTQQEAPQEETREEDNSASSLDEDNSEKDGDDAPEVTKLRAELERAENRHKKAHNLVSEVSRKLKAFEKKVNRLLEDGVLQQEEAQNLLNEAAHEELEEALETNPLLKLFKIGNEGINKIRASIEDGILDEDPILDKKIRAFDSFFEDATDAEKRKTFESLAKLEKEPIKLAKKMIAIGQQYYEEVYGEIVEAGNLRNFKQKYQAQINELQKKIDKQEKQILKYKEQYEDFIPSKTMKLPAGGGKEAPEESSTSLAGIFAKSKAGTLSRS